jgi:Protein of unknown function (DUF4236)
MGWNFRKPFNFGPLRVNLSRRGVGYSVGVRGFRDRPKRKGPELLANVRSRHRNLQSQVFGTSGEPANRRNWSVPLLIAVLLALLLLKFLLK